MSHVYVVQQSSHNIGPARIYGEIVVMLMHDDVNEGPDRMAYVLNSELRNVKPEDYILCIGDPVAIGLAIHFALVKTKGKINVLTWDKRKYAYEESTINVI